jgi:hypothetical protein
MLATRIAAQSVPGAMGDPVLSPLAAFLIGHPAAIEALLTEHADDGRGHCRVCTIGAQQGHVVWPCTLFIAATAAQRAMRRRRRPP